MSEAAPRRLKTIDALRGGAALAVVAYHLSASATLALAPGDVLYYPLYPIRYGYTGVGLFLVVSGFCIHISNARSRRVSFLAFWKRRLLRLYPPYLACIILSLTVGVLGATTLKGGPAIQWPLPPYGNTQEFWLDLFAHVFLLHTLFAFTVEGLYNPPLWSLALEEQLYMLYWGWLLICRRFSSRRAIWGVMLLSLIWNLVDTSMVWKRLGPCRWFEWCLGALAADAYGKNEPLPKWCYDIRLLVPLVILAVNPDLSRVSDMLFGAAYFILLNFVITKESSGLSCDRGWGGMLAFVGGWSYSLYLMHVPLLKLSYGVLSALHLAKFWWAQLLFMPTGALLGSWLFFHLVERHFLRPPGVVSSTSAK